MLRPLAIMAIIVILCFAGGIICQKIAENDCAKHDAKPVYTYSVQYICVNSDGKIVK